MREASREERRVEVRESGRYGEGKERYQEGDGGGRSEGEGEREGG